MNDLKIVAKQALGALLYAYHEDEAHPETLKIITALSLALAELPANPAPGYCKHCKQYTIEEPLPAEPVTQALEALNKMQSIMMMGDGRHPRDVLRSYIQLTTSPQRKPPTKMPPRKLPEDHDE